RRADAALARERLPAALRDPVARALDRVGRNGGGFGQHLRGIGVVSAGVFFDLVAHRYQRVQQRLVAGHGTAALLNAFDARRQHLLEVVERDAALVARQGTRAHEAGAPDRPRAAAYVT